MKRTWLEVDRENLKSNYELIKKLAPDKEIIGVIKANGYGCGSIQIAKELVKLGINFFGVACLQEALELREKDVDEEILVFGAVNHEEYEIAFENKIQISVSKFEDIEFIEKSNFRNPRVHVKIDTGMGRVGFLNKEIYNLLESRENLKKCKIQGVFSHFSCADLLDKDEYTLMQIENFSRYTKISDLKYLHIQNSAGIIRFNNKCKGTHARAGIMMYGYSDLHPDLKPVTKLKSIISHLKKIEEDLYISYGKEGLAKKGSMVATIPIGYADGYSRRFSNKGEMYIKGYPCKVLGKVCMDMTMIEIPESLQSQIKIGDEVDVLGDDPMKQLKKAQVSPYEYLVGIGNRVKRVYK